jgi:hypothetical protein
MKLSLLSVRKAWILSCCLIVAGPPAVAQFVELTAEIEVSEWRARDVTTWPTAIRCVVGTNSWQMEGDFSENARVTYWFTGTNIVEHHVVTKKLPDEPRRPGFPAFGSPAVGAQWARVFASTDGNPGQPVRQADRMTLVARVAWLAFCSGPCLKREGRTIFPPSDLWKELVSPEGFSDKTVTFGDSLGVPKTLDLYTSEGQPIVQYRVNSSTNVMDWEFPLEFYIAQYCPAPLPENPRVTTGTNGWQLQFTARGRVTKAEVGAQPEIPSEVWRTADK